MAGNEVELLQQEMKGLLQEELYDSAEMLGTFLLSAQVKHSNSAQLSFAQLESQSFSFALLADSIYGKGEYRRALVCPHTDAMYKSTSSTPFHAA